MNNNGDKIKNLSFIRLAMVAIGATIGGGVFSLSGDFAANGADTGAVLVGWIVCGVGTLALMLCFFGLNRTKPELTGGIYSYAAAGWGDYVGFNSAYGYWLSTLLGTVAYAGLLFAAIGYFFPMFDKGNNAASMICASGVMWFMCYLVSRGVKEAAGVNLVITISKLVPVLTFIVFTIFLRHFDLNIFLENFWGDGSISFLDQVKATTATTVWAFIGVEGAVAISERAKISKDVGRATLTAFFCVIGIYILVSGLSMGVLTREELAALGNPPLAGVMKAVVGPWGAAFINIGVIVSLTGATLGFTIIGADVPYSAALRGAFSKFFAKENSKGAPINSLILTTALIQLFIVVTYFNESTYQIFYTLSASMIMIPYLLSGLYYAKITFKKDGFERLSKKELCLQKVIAVMGTAYGIWLIYAAGLVGLFISTLLYAPGAILYYISKKEKNEPIFDNKRDICIFVALLLCGLTTLVLIISGQINPFS